MTHSARSLTRACCAASAALLLATFVPPLAAVANAAVSGSDTIMTFAGTGTSGHSGDGSDSLLANVNPTGALAVASSTDAWAGSLFFAEDISGGGSFVIRRVQPDGTITTFLGGGSGTGPDAATHEPVRYIAGIDVTPDGLFYSGSRGGGLETVQRIDTSGNLAEVAHYSICSGCNTGGLAVKDSTGEIFIASGASGVQRIVWAPGQVQEGSTVFFGGSSGGCGPVKVGDPSVTVDGKVRNVSDVELNNAQSLLYVADDSNHEVFAVPLNNIGGYYTLTGGGADPQGCSNDGVVKFPEALAVGPDDHVYSESYPHEVVDISTTGTSQVIAGNGTSGFSGDGGPANQAQLNAPFGIGLNSAGALFIADDNNFRIRSVGLSPWCPGYRGDSRNQIVGTAAKDILSGTTGADIICGLGGRDTLKGLGGNDLLLGGADNDLLTGAGGNDVLYGEAGNDSLNGGAGGDQLDGGDGIDTASYTGASTVGVNVNLQSPQSASGGWAAGDTLVGFENVTGSSGADTLTGNDQNNVLQGGLGSDQLDGAGANDTLQGGAGADVLTPGLGVDSIDYFDSTAAVAIDIGTNALSGGFADGDSIVGTGGTAAGFERIRGSQFDDTLTANGLANLVQGFGGSDHLYGLARNDTIYGGEGDDFLYGGAGADRLYGEGGNDALDGEADSDTCVPGAGTNNTAFNCEFLVIE
ncbi:MAG: hypothetical protein M3290_09435 [Actinomycetota bacterium]|nr:hypothetical protein [Actinomycetota bacterium]